MMQFFYYITFLILFIWIIKKWQFFDQSSLNFKWRAFFFIVKVVVSFIVYFIYTYYYPNMRIDSDIFKYYDDSQIMYKALKDSPKDYFKMLTGINDDNQEIKEKYYQKMNFWIKPYNYELVNENKTIIRLNAFISLFSFNNYFIHNLIFLFLSYIGLFALFKLLSTYFVQNKIILAIFIFLMPSTIFWSSAIIKESLVFFNLGLLLYNIDKIMKKFNLKTFALIVFFATMLGLSKMYILILILPGLLTLFLNSFFPKIKLWISFIIAHILLILFFFHSEYFIPFNFSEIVVAKQHDFINMVNSFNYVGSKINIPLLNNMFTSFLLNSPNAIINTLFRPTLLEAHNLTSLMAAFENTFIIFIFIFILLFFKKADFNKWMWFGLSFSFMLFTLIGLTTPVLGALVRYKIPALPFFMFILISFINFEKIYNKIKLLWQKLSS